MRILDLAEQLIRLSGLLPYKDVQIVFTGLRPGEKLQEELVGPGEAAVETSVDKIRLVERNGVHGDELARRLRHLTRITARRDELSLFRALVTLAPGYRLPQPPLGYHAGHNGNGYNGNGHNGNGRNGNGHNGNGHNGNRHNGTGLNGNHHNGHNGGRLARHPALPRDRGQLRLSPPDAASPHLPPPNDTPNRA